MGTSFNKDFKDRLIFTDPHLAFIPGTYPFMRDLFDASNSSAFPGKAPINSSNIGSF